MTIDNDTAQRTKAALVGLGYKFLQQPGPDEDDEATWHFSPPADADDRRRWSNACWDDEMFPPSSERAAIRDALANSLNNKALTGARIADLGNISLRINKRGGQFIAFIPGPEDTTPIQFGSTPDEAIATLWLRVHDLPDPRKQVTA